MSLYESPPKQSSQQIMPGQDELASIHAQLRDIAATLEETPAAQQVLSDPQTSLQCHLRRGLLRLKIARSGIVHAAEIVESLLK